MAPEHWLALQAIHGATHGVGMNIKYTWFGPGYISNVYFKRIANKPTYQIGTGAGDTLHTFHFFYQEEET